MEQKTNITPKQYSDLKKTGELETILEVFKLSGKTLELRGDEVWIVTLN